MPKKSVETHVYMTPEIKKRLEHFAKLNHRSVNGQIMHYIQSGVEHDDLVRSDKNYHANR